MKEEQLKKIIEKSTIETSDDFINNLMSSVEMNQERKKSLKRLFKTVLIVISILSIAISFILFQYTGDKNSPINVLTHIPKTPLFVVFMIAILGYINAFIRLNEQNKV